MIDNHIKSLRLDRNITQEELANHLEISRQTIISIEKGNYTPSLLLAMQISKFFNIPVEKIFRLKN